MMLFQKFAQWENTKASLARAVPDGVCYQGFQNLQPKVYTLSFGYLHIPWTLSITTRINEIQSTASGQGTW